MLGDWLRRILGFDVIAEYLREIIYRLDALMARTDDLSAELTELGGAVDDLSARIDALPVSADEITQEQLDSLRNSITRVTGLAQAAPEVPTDPAPVDNTGL